MLHTVTVICDPPRGARMVMALASVCFHAVALVHVQDWKTSLHLANAKNFHHNDTLASSDPIYTNESTEQVLPNASALVDSLKVLKSLNTHVQTIQSQIQLMQNQDASSLAKKGVELEHQLEIQRSEITAAEAKNAHLANDIEELRKTNNGLRKKANVLTDATHKVRQEILQMQSNVSIAMEFMHQTLNVSNQLLNASEVQITKDLDSQEALMQKQLARVKSLKSFGMLQVSSEKKLVPAEMVQGLIGTLEDYARQKVAHESSLNAVFENRFRAGGEKLVALRAAYQELSTTYQAENELHGRLTTAVGHLEKTYVQLARQKQALAKFFQNLKDQTAAAV